jgi:DNA-directed RNA polymerase specialized sigma24 family protein
MQRLCRLWSTYLAQVAWRDAVEHGADVAVAAQALIGLPEVSITEALDANRRLVDLLLDRRRDVVSAARKEGWSWAAVGAALGVSKQRAYARYHHVVSHSTC